MKLSTTIAAALIAAAEARAAAASSIIDFLRGSRRRNLAQDSAVCSVGTFTCEDFCVDLITTAQTEPVGKVCVHSGNYDGILDVWVRMADDWALTEAHAHVGEDLMDDFPTMIGLPGNMDRQSGDISMYGKRHNFKINLSEKQLCCDTDLEGEGGQLVAPAMKMAYQATVQRKTGNDIQTEMSWADGELQTETAWADGELFSTTLGNNGGDGDAKYFEVCLTCDAYKPAVWTRDPTSEMRFADSTI